MLLYSAKKSKFQQAELTYPSRGGASCIQSMGRIAVRKSAKFNFEHPSWVEPDSGPQGPTTDHKELTADVFGLIWESVRKMVTET